MQRHLLNTNAWNRLRYSLYAPFYDLAGRRFDACRRASLGRLELRRRERVLLVGAGTGGDLPFLPDGVRAIVSDLTPAMLRQARRQARPGLRPGLVVMDGHALALPDGSCDAAVLHLILAVLPDPVRCLRETARVLRPGGRAVVFDKFVRGPGVPLGLRLVNLVTGALATEVTRRFEDILRESGAPLAVERDEAALLGGLFRYLLLRRS